MTRIDQYGVRRDDSGAPNKHDRQLEDQEWKIKVVSGQEVFLRFENSVFRRHFVVASKKATPTPIKEKMEHRARARFACGKEAKHLPASLFPLRPGDSKSARLNRYNRTGHNTSTLVDTTVLGVDAVMTAMAKKLLAVCEAEQWDIGSEKDVTFEFTSACVQHVTVTAVGDQSNAMHLEFQHAVPSTKILFKVQRAHDTTFSFAHCYGPG